MNLFSLLRLLFFGPPKNDGPGKRVRAAGPPTVRRERSQAQVPVLAPPQAAPTRKPEPRSVVASEPTSSRASSPLAGQGATVSELPSKPPSGGDMATAKAVAIDSAPATVEAVIEAREQLPPEMPPPRIRPRGGRVTVIVGFDYGTHSTKILYRKRGEDAVRVLRLGESAPGYPQFAIPSLVRVRDGQLWFGTAALAHSDGTLYRSLKVRLLGPDAEKELEPFPPGPCPDHLVAAFLCWAFQGVRDKLVAEFTDPDYRVNLAAPMDHVENAQLKTRYLQIAQAAWNLVLGPNPITVTQGIRFAELEEHLRREFDRPPSPDEDRKFDVLPETIAPIVSMSLDPRTAPGMHMIVDVGAGTTEISVNHVGERGADHRVRCYCDKTRLIGGDQFERIKGLPKAEQESRCRALVAELMKAVKQVWQTGYLKDAPNHAARPPWRNLVLLLTGGGGRHDDVIREIRATPPINAWPHKEVVYKVTWHTPVNVDLGNGNSAEDLPLLAVACGLTRERETWPTVFEPKSVEEMSPSAVASSPDPYWYVGGK